MTAPRTPAPRPFTPDEIAKMRAAFNAHMDDLFGPGYRNRHRMPGDWWDCEESKDERGAFDAGWAAALPSPAAAGPVAAGVYEECALVCDERARKARGRAAAVKSGAASQAFTREERDTYARDLERDAIEASDCAEFIRLRARKERT